ncbi:MAG: GNAT family N-acetyltransferase [Thermoplasmata archaeon]
MPGADFLRGEKVDLLTIEEEYIEWMRDNINDPEVRKGLSARYPQNLSQERDFLENSVEKDDDQVHLLISSEGKKLGLISLFDIDRDDGNAELGIWIMPSEQGKGYGTEACKVIIDYGFRELRLHRIYARVYEHNSASFNMFEKLGFEKEGIWREHGFVDGEYEDMHLLGILKCEWIS